MAREVYQRQWPITGIPQGIAVHDQEVYVTDASNGIVQVFDHHGNPLRTLGSGQFATGGQRTGPGRRCRQG
jgi:hypothetical protein